MSMIVHLIERSIQNIPLCISMVYFYFTESIDGGLTTDNGQKESRQAKCIMYCISSLYLCKTRHTLHHEKQAHNNNN